MIYVCEVRQQNTLTNKYVTESNSNSNNKWQNRSVAYTSFCALTTINAAETTSNGYARTYVCLILISEDSGVGKVEYVDKWG